MISEPRLAFSFASSIAQKNEALVVLCAQNFDFTGELHRLDQECGGRLKRAVEVTNFDGSAGEVEVIAPIGLNVGRVILFAVGKNNQLAGLDFTKLGACLFTILEQRKITSAEVVTEGLSDESICEFAHGLELRSYRFDKYLTKQDDRTLTKLRDVTIICRNYEGVEAGFAPKVAAAAGNRLARDLAHEAPNVLYPASYADAVKDHLEPLGVEVTVLNEQDMAQWGALLGVGQGSIRESRCVVMQWRGATTDQNERPIAFVGKGVTFDTGGISIKPSAGMWEMKMDMGGSAAVIGLMTALAKRQSKVNAVGIVGLVENMPDGGAQRPGDIVKSLSGQTIQVLDTDAEGRLVLADVLTYVQETYKPRAIVDLATLTGAMIVSLGYEKSGLFSNNDALADQIFTAGEVTGEHVWRMPLGKEYNKKLDSAEADMANIGGKRTGGSITAACFLERFINNDTPWAHLDIAGTAWPEGGNVLTGNGATGVGVRLLNQLVADHYES